MKSHVRLPGLNRNLVLELDRRRVRELMLVVALSALMLLPLLAYVWQNVEWIEGGYRIETLKNQRDRLVEMNHQLKLERASLENLARVERVATERLGLAQPPSGTVVLVDGRRLKPAGRRASGAIASGAAQSRGSAERYAAELREN